MKPFEKRKFKGTVAEKTFQDVSVEKGYDYCRNGYEVKFCSAGFNKKLRSDLKKLDKYYKAIRYRPDYILIWPDGKITYCEVKSVPSIERDSYEVCKKENLPMFLFIVNKNGLFYKNISDIKLDKNPKVTFTFNNKKITIPVVTDEEGNAWVCPEKLSEEELTEYKNQKHGSGKSFCSIGEDELKTFTNLISDDELEIYQKRFRERELLLEESFRMLRARKTCILTTKKNIVIGSLLIREIIQPWAYDEYKIYEVESDMSIPSNGDIWLGNPELLISKRLED